ncbi:TonB-dependent siderophore receptor [Sphingomonas sp. A2-49]|uniref:TonB-dependent receptor n=1 Tax=Sphingomonas sp. A2-49 TaxID=1391375 RepID=UPI0021D31104|nr:TonB-dependent siderophore receptor [Sphingomonas sp. A2-49]MCU6455366.1 TonB-dependent siderophore receptor [Sphingomonas sp. A2-49]
MTQALFRAASSLALAAATPALAQEVAGHDADIVVTAQGDNQTQVLRRGQVGVLGTQDAADVPFAIRSYNAALILNQQPQTLGQVLENDPSVRTTYGFGNAAEQFVIRGFTLFGDDIGLDGLYGITPRQLVSPELYEQVQVLNGASAFLNGAAPGGSGIGGSVNLIPKRAGDRDLMRATANYTESGHVGGAFDASHRFGDGSWGVRINGAYRAGDVAVDDEFRRNAVLGGAIDYRGSNLRLSLDLAYQRVTVRRLRPKVTIATATIPRVPDADANYAQAFTYTTLRDLFGTARAEYDVAPNATLYAAFGARDGAEEGLYSGLTVTDAATGAATGTALYVPRTDNNEAANAGIRVTLASGGITHRVNIGASHVWQVNRNAYDFRYGPGFAGFATNLYATPQVALPASTLVGGNLADPFPISRTRLGSAFASDTLGAFGDRVLLTAGLRLQSIAVRGYAASDGRQNSRYAEDAVTPVVGLVVKPVDGLSLYANRIEGLSQGPTAPTDATVINPGEIFAPFRSTQYEVGGKLAIGRFNASLAAYTITLPSAYAVADPGGSGLLRYGVYGEQRNRGIELGLDGEIARGLRLIAGASLTDADLREQATVALDGNTAVGVPDYLANANLEWDLPFARGLTLTGRVVRTGRQQVNAANTLEIPAWTRFDLGGRYVAVVADRPLTLRVNVDNVANRRYWASAYDSFAQALLQGAPRTVKASVSMDF